MTQRVFIVWTYPLFRETIGVLLDHPEITIIGDESDRDAARATIKSLQPDIIIIEETVDGEPIDTDILDYLEASAWEPKIARLSLQDNELQLYHRQHRTIKTRNDLLELLHE